MGAKRVTDKRWPVAKSYDIRNKDSAGSKRILHTASAEVERWYNPLEDKKLPWEFARVTDDQSLRVFAHKYGELGYHYIEDIIASSEYYNDRINLPGEPAEWILKHAEQVRVFRRLYGLLRRTLEEWDRIDDRASVSSNKIEQCPDWSSLPQSLSEEVTQAMRELRDTTPGATIETHKDGTETTWARVITLNGGQNVYGDGFERSRYGNAHVALLYRLAHAIVNENTRAVTFAMRETADKQRPHQAPTVECDSLLEAIYYHLKKTLEQLVWEDADERPCRRLGCLNMFKSSDRREHFCSDECRKKHRRDCNRLYQAKVRANREVGKVVSE